MAGEEKEALDVLNQLAENALRESRFYDASYYYRIKAVQLLDGYTNIINETEDTNNIKKDIIEKWINFTELADICFAYNSVFKYAVIF